MSPAAVFGAGGLGGAGGGGRDIGAVLSPAVVCGLVCSAAAVVGATLALSCRSPPWAVAAVVHRCASLCVFRDSRPFPVDVGCIIVGVAFVVLQWFFLIFFKKSLTFSPRDGILYITRGAM